MPRKFWVNQRTLIALLIVTFAVMTWWPAARVSRAAVWDDAKFKINHNGNPPVQVVKDFDKVNKAIPKGQSKELEATSEKGNGVKEIKSTRLQVDPNGLVAVATPGKTKVTMVTHADAASMDYPLTIGGRYVPITAGGGGGGGGGPSDVAWKGNSETKVDGAGVLTIGNVVRGVGLPYSVSWRDAAPKEVDIIFGDNWPGGDATLTIENQSQDNGTAKFIDDQGNPQVTITVSKLPNESRRTIKVKGVSHTAANKGPQLTIHATWSQGGGGTADSAAFAVCAHPVRLTFKFKKLLDPVEALQGNQMSTLWGSRYEYVPEDADSDSGNKADLNQVKIRENVTQGLKQGYFKDTDATFTGDFVNVGTIDDDNRTGVPGILVPGDDPAQRMVAKITANPLDKNTSSVYQLFEFSCARCQLGEDHPAIIRQSGFHISYRTTKDAQSNKYYLGVKRDGHAFDGAEAGATDATPIWHDAEIKNIAP